MNCSIDRAAVGGVPVLILRGGLDRGSCVSLVDAMDQVSLGGHRTIGLDLGRVQCVGHRALPLLLSACERLRGHRRQVRIVAASDEVHSLLDQKGLGFLELGAEDQGRFYTA